MNDHPLTTLLGVCGYEFRMQFRRAALWIATSLTVLLPLALLLSRSEAELGLGPVAGVYARTTFVLKPVSYVLPIAFGILLADRLPRERRLKTLELQQSLPTANGVWLWGKYLGAAAATAVPVFLCYLAAIVAVAIKAGQFELVPALFVIFPVVVLPGLLFAGACTIACTEFLPAALYSILFVGYWFWGNLVLPSRLPTISCTPLTPIGKYAASAFFNLRMACGPSLRHASTLAGLESIALLLAAAAVALIALSIYTDRRAASQ